ncbi:DUF547 domain-containing protein [Shewanella sp. Choline-02u-19]|uniref:DUF547 domain-containing protein n=1 Tax=unclassified Shewanella TaxID=196818 RepID=UPI000C32FA73|nr:DUF547 domain-containing protein [Shewanella sp. Bg11-22]PKI29385.1 DUF547 domain-containing protein [Shewanella sp. Choline-02u-19]
MKILTRYVQGLLLAVSIVLSHIAMAADAPSAPHLHDDWQQLLIRNVQPINQGHSSAVDYRAMLQDRSILKGYLNQLSLITQTTFDGWDTTQQLAFLINAYNAWTVEFILTTYPDIDSIKALGSFFRSPWDKSFIPLLGETRSLNDIEHKLIRGSGRYNDPRIHFAVNCASIGCPALREEAYTGAKLEQQLAAQTERFVADTRRNYFKDGTLYLSSIFKWYDEDFTMGFNNSHSVAAFLLLYIDVLELTPAQQAALTRQEMQIEFLDYDWSLNDNQ